MYTAGYFKGKKITVMGLGLLGRGVGDVRFLAQEGAELIVTDLKTKEELIESLKELSLEKIGKDAFSRITYVLGEHRLEDFKNRDFILKAAGVPLDSVYIAEARKNNIPVEMSSALFVALTKATIIGITGTRGKSTVTHLIYEILKENYKNSSIKIFLGGNVRGVATLPFVRDAKKGDIAVLELDSWQLQGFGERKISPHISVFTNLMSDHVNYYKDDPEQYFKDKANIFLYQKQNDYLLTDKKVAHLITAKYFGKLANQPIELAPDIIPHGWNVGLKGEHNRLNTAFALRVATIVGIDYEIIKKVVESFQGVPGRLELIALKRGVKFYNDTNATTPDATIAALRALGSSKDLGQHSHQNIILIAGGADKKLDMTQLIQEIPLYVKTLILLPGTGTARILSDIKKAGIDFIEVKTLKEAYETAYRGAKTGDSILLSPAFASFGLFSNEYDRGDQFVALVTAS